jgi:phosphohistidine phosphatase
VKIWIIRHAKSSWAQPGLSDFDRPLNDRGRADGPRMAAWLASQDAPAEWIWTSDAARARATAAFVERGFSAARPLVVEEHALYHASARGALDVLRGTPEAVASVALVAHNPGLTDLVNLLAGNLVTENLPTFGVARFDVAAPWHSVGEQRADLEILTAPKEIPS